MNRRVGAAGYLTVFMTGILAVLMSFCLALIEGVRGNGILLEAEIALDTGMEAVFSEYHKVLFQRYNLFAIDASYQSREAGVWQMEKRLSDYVSHNLSPGEKLMGFQNRDFLDIRLGELEITAGTCLTDGGGKVFCKALSKALLSEMGVSYLENLSSWVDTIRVQEQSSIDILEKRNQIDAAISDCNRKRLQEKDNPKVIESPVAKTEGRLSAGILSLVVDNPGALSAKGINQTGLFEQRYACGEINQGNQTLGEELSVTEELAFCTYLYRNFSRYMAESENTVLSYEAEYLIHGADSDASNLKGVVTRIYGLRELVNCGYIFSDATKCREAYIAAAVSATLVGAPELTEVFQNAILLAWASIESVFDMRMLLHGKRIPLVKSRDSWHTDLDGVLKGIFQDEEESGSAGLAYEDYIRVFLAMEDEKTLSLRAINLMEANIRTTKGNEAFRMDACYTALGASLQVDSGFGYSFSLSKMKKYE